MDLELTVAHGQAQPSRVRSVFRTREGSCRIVPRWSGAFRLLSASGPPANAVDPAISGRAPFWTGLRARREYSGRRLMIVSVELPDFLLRPEKPRRTDRPCGMRQGRPNSGQSLAWNLLYIPSPPTAPETQGKRLDVPKLNYLIIIKVVRKSDPLMHLISLNLTKFV